MKGITANAKQLISTIVEEYRMQDDRVRKGFIERHQALPYLHERLQRLAMKDPNLRKFLDDVGYIDHREDEDPTLPWAPDPRPENEQHGPPSDGRREVLRRILESGKAESQKALIDAMAAAGFVVSQPTMVRDLRDIGATKTAAGYELKAA